MRRAALLTTLLAAAALAVALVAGSSAQGDGNGTFNVVFDDARGLISGQLVKVAGAKAGTITDVKVTDQNGTYRALVTGTIESKFLPFHQDATCQIRPEGLIAENYVDCDPGTPSAPVLPGSTPTVPVNHTSEPVSLLDLFNIFNLPTRQRFQVIIDELGMGTAGRGDDFNDIIRRANPALQLADQAIGILNRQKNQLAQIVDDSNTIAAQGATHTQDVQNFLDQAASLTQTTASHSSQLSQAIAKLPANLNATDPALQQLDSVARSGTPLLSEIHAAVPSLNRVANDLGPFVTAAKPGLAKLGTAITTAIPAVKQTTPLIKTLRTYLHGSQSTTRLFSKLAVNLEKSGFSENFLTTVYDIAAATARNDNVSHLLSLLLVGPGNGSCAVYATTPTAVCSAHYTDQSGASAATKTPALTPSAPAATPSTPSSGASGTSSGSGASAGGSTGGSTGTTGLLGTGINIPIPGLGALTGGAGQAASKAGSALQNLLGYLTK